jgi:hypothetical protein
LAADAVRRFVAELITIRRFGMSAPKQEMVSWHDRIVSSPQPDETIAGKIEGFQANAMEVEGLLEILRFVGH